MFTSPLSLRESNSLANYDDDFLHQIYQLVMHRSIDDPKREKLITELSIFLSQRRSYYKINSPLDELIQRAIVLGRQANNNELRSFLVQSLKGLKDIQEYYQQIVFNILANEGTAHRKVFTSQDFNTDIKDYAWLIGESAKIGSTILLDELGIYRILRKKVYLSKEPLQKYIHKIQSLYEKTDNDSTVKPYLIYLRDALNMIQSHQ